MKATRCTYQPDQWPGRLGKRSTGVQQGPHKQLLESGRTAASLATAISYAGRQCLQNLCGKTRSPPGLASRSSSSSSTTHSSTRCRPNSVRRGTRKTSGFVLKRLRPARMHVSTHYCVDVLIVPLLLASEFSVCNRGRVSRLRSTKSLSNNINVFTATLFLFLWTATDIVLLSSRGFYRHTFPQDPWWLHTNCSNKYWGFVTIPQSFQDFRRSSIRTTLGRACDRFGRHVRNRFVYGGNSFTGQRHRSVCE